MNGLGRLLIGCGLLLLFAGILLLIFDRMGIPRLPGDVSYRGKSVSVYFPLGTCILLSVLLSLIFYVLSRFLR